MPLINIDGFEETLELPDGSRLIDLEVEYFGMKYLPFGCRVGVCGACLVEVCSGSPHLGMQSTEEAAFIRRLGHDPDHHRLACRCTLTGDVSLKPLGRPRRASLPKRESFPA